MIDPTPSPSAIEQARLDASIAAAAAERANRPRGLVVLGAALVVVAVAYLLYAISDRASRQAALARSRKDLQDLTALADQIQTASRELAARGTTPDNTMVGKLEALAQAAGIAVSAGITEQRNPAVAQTGMAQRRYNANFSNQSPSAILSWLTNVQSAPNIAGLEISRLQIRPSGQPVGAGAAASGAAPEAGWNVVVEFTRWEKTS